MKRKNKIIGAGAAILTVAGLVLSQVLSSPVPVGDIGQANNWTLAFEDNFDGSVLDLAKWRANWLGGSDTAITKPINTAEVACFNPANVSVGNGELIISAVQKTCKVGSATWAYTSGVITSYSDYQFTYGFAEARMWMPAGAGVWPAFWTDGAGLNWPTSGEIDIVECYGTDGSCSPHYHYSGGGPGKTVPVIGSTSGWHTYAGNWQPGKIDWYYDGVLVYTQTQGVISVPHFLIVNLGLKGTSPTVPATLRVDYVRVWKADGAVPVASLTSSPTNTFTAIPPTTTKTATPILPTATPGVDARCDPKYLSNKVCVYPLP